MDAVYGHTACVTVLQFSFFRVLLSVLLMETVLRHCEVVIVQRCQGYGRFHQAEAIQNVCFIIVSK